MEDTDLPSSSQPSSNCHHLRPLIFFAGDFISCLAAFIHFAADNVHEFPHLSLLSSLLTDKRSASTRYGLKASHSSTLCSSASTVASSFTSRDADDDVRRVQTAKFQASGISTFLAAYHEATRPRTKRLVLLCHEGCGGIADRIQGIPYAMGLAVMMKRQICGSSILVDKRGVPANILEATVHFFIDGYCSDAATLQNFF
jgi:hypothetical protein